MVAKFTLAIILLLILTFQSNANVLINSTIFLPFIRARTLPNIIIFLADDMGMGDISPYNSAITYTPNIQALSERSKLYTRFYAFPTCVPTRFSLLTGLHPVRVPEMLSIGSVRTIPTELTTLPERLEQAGYQTGHIAKWHLGEGESRPLNHGFLFSRGIFLSPLTGEQLPGTWDDLSGQNRPVRGYPNLTTNATTAAIHFMQQVPTNQPLFLYMAYTMPHIPLFPSFENFTGEGIYADTIAEIDWSVGEILAEIDSRGQTDNTLVIFLSDNGPYQPREINPVTLEPLIPQRHQTDDYWLLNYEDIQNPGRFYGGISDNDFGLIFRKSTYDANGNRLQNAGKGSAYEAAIRVPVMMAYPGIIQPGIDNEPHATMDIYATIEKLISGRVTYAIDGVDIFNDSHQKHYYYQPSGSLSAVIDGDWKYHYGTGELFNLAINTEEISANDLSISNPAKTEELRLLGLAQEAEKRGVLP